jgi:hypothetical protein
MADLRNYWTEFHETWWSYRYMFLVGHKVFSFVVTLSKLYCKHQQCKIKIKVLKNVIRTIDDP